MSKLIIEPRVPKVITDIKKKPRFKKTKSESDIKPKYTVIKEGYKFHVEELFRVYKDNPYHARVKYFNNKNFYNFDRVVIFEYSDIDFEICMFSNKVGISVTNRIYSSQKKVCSIIYKNNKFYYISKRKSTIIRPLTFGLLNTFISETEGIYSHRSVDDTAHPLDKSKTFSFLKERFPWVRTISESKISLGINFNVVNKNKIFGLNEINRHIMKVPNNITKMILDSRLLSNLRNTTGNPIKRWYEILKILDGVQNITPELLNSDLFIDTCNMAITLGRKINCRWGLKRLNETHDKWSLEITNIILDCEVEYDLDIDPVYLAFESFSGYKLLKTNKDMLREGMLQNHCVGTYIDKVNSGNCAIFHVSGYTLQVGVVFTENNKNEQMVSRTDALMDVSSKSLYNMQFRGKYNEDAPFDLITKVRTKLLEFSNDGWFDRVNEFKNSVKKEKRVKENPNHLVELQLF